jgi:hypothetical protein
MEAVSGPSALQFGLSIGPFLARMVLQAQL